MEVLCHITLCMKGHCLWMASILSHGSCYFSWSVANTFSPFLLLPGYEMLSLPLAICLHHVLPHLSNIKNQQKLVDYKVFSIFLHLTYSCHKFLSHSNHHPICNFYMGYNFYLHFLFFNPLILFLQFVLISLFNT